MQLRLALTLFELITLFKLFWKNSEHDEHDNLSEAYAHDDAIKKPASS
jgi:hypothetical protein